jgi:hypothetical protein
MISKIGFFKKHKKNAWYCTFSCVNFCISTCVLTFCLNNFTYLSNMNTMITSWQVQRIFNVENYFIWKILFLEIKSYKFFQKIFKIPSQKFFL